jgi:type III pantothenate kinase
MTMIRYVVDIGNSGLRCVLCPSQGPNQCTAIPELQHPVHKVYWHAHLPTDTNIPTSRKSSNNESILQCDRINPDDSSGLVNFLEQSLLRDSKTGAIDLKQPVEWCVSSVHEGALRTLEIALSQCRPHDQLRKVTHLDVPMALDVESPEKLGIDRLLAAFAAYQSNKCKGPIVSIQAGTAVTVDLVSSTGCFMGGAILPGMGLALSSLSRGTSKLPLINNVVSNSEATLPGKNTEQAILAGVQASILGGTIYLVKRYRSAHADNQIPVVVSGGDGPFIVQHIPGPAIGLDNLVLRSLVFLFGDY